jgi:hypothetical protein
MEFLAFIFKLVALCLSLIAYIATTTENDIAKKTVSMHSSIFWLLVYIAITISQAL